MTRKSQKRRHKTIAEIMAKVSIYKQPFDFIEMNPDALILFRAKMSKSLKIKDFKEHSRLYAKGIDSVKIICNPSLPVGEWRAIGKSGRVIDFGNIVQDIRRMAVSSEETGLISV